MQYLTGQIVIIQLTQIRVGLLWLFILKQANFHRWFFIWKSIKEILQLRDQFLMPPYLLPSEYLGIGGPQKRAALSQSSGCFSLLPLVLNTEHRSLPCVLSITLNPLHCLWIQYFVSKETFSWWLWHNHTMIQYFTKAGMTTKHDLMTLFSFF